MSPQVDARIADLEVLRFTNASRALVEWPSRPACWCRAKVLGRPGGARGWWNSLMRRAEAIDLLVRRDLAHLSGVEREALLLDWWTIDASDPDYGNLPDPLREALGRTDQPDDPGQSLYDPLVRIGLRRAYVGVLNTYLTSQIATLGHHEAVDGDVEELAACPCCGYRTLRERGACEICCACFWEDDGTTALDSVSGANHLTLREARLNVQRFGAVDERAREHVLTDARARYAAAGS
jgi:hypothetical protein